MPQGWTFAKLFGELAEITREARSRAELRLSLIVRLERQLGFDAAVWGTTLDLRSAWNFDERQVFALAELPLMSEDIAYGWSRVVGRVAAIDLGYSSQEKGDSMLWQEMIYPTGTRGVLGCAWRTATDQCASLTLARSGKRGFSPSEMRRFALLRPLLALGEDRFAPRANHSGIKLTVREGEIIALVERGMTNAEIGRVLGISSNTVRNRLAAVFERLGVANRAELVTRLHAER